MHQPSESISTALKSNALGITRIVFAFLAVWLMSGAIASAQTKKPNILVIWGDDVGWSNGPMASSTQSVGPPGEFLDKVLGLRRIPESPGHPTSSRSGTDINKKWLPS